jgi:LysR family cys regulon transcriptional activator
MELYQLHTFYEVVHTGSFSKASKTVFRSQSAISHQITNLEKELSIKLFERIGKMLRLTEEGKILFEFVSPFFNNLENLKRIYEDMQQCKRGSLTIAATNAIITYCLPEIIKNFLRQFPGIKFKLTTCNMAPEIQPTVIEGYADLGIGPKSVLLSQKIDFLPWRTFDKFLIAAKDHPISQRKEITLDEISRYPLIMYREGAAIRTSIEEAFKRKNLSYEVIMEMNVAENIKKYVEMGIGLSIIHSFTISHDEKRRFALFNVNHLFGNIEYGIFYRKDKYITAAMKQFIRYFAPNLLYKFPS